MEAVLECIAAVAANEVGKEDEVRQRLFMLFIEVIQQDSWPQLFENWIPSFIRSVSIQRSQHIPFDAFGKISAQTNDSYSFTLVLYKVHMAI